MPYLQPRLETDVAKMVRKLAKRNSRSIPKEVNHVLREHYTTPIQSIIGIGPGEPMPPYHTVLDPTPRTSPDLWKEAPLEISFGATTKRGYRKMAAFAKKMTKLHNGTSKKTHAKNMTNARG